jgi:transcriptional regulator with XRE-family HTH domain
MKNKTTATAPNPDKPSRIQALRQTPLPPGDDVGAAELARRVAANLKEKRKTRNLSLDELAVASGVSRATLSQIEMQKSNPSLSVLWKIAVGLGVPFSDLLGGHSPSTAILRRTDAQILRSTDGRMESRPLAPAGSCPWVEAYELRLAARSTHTSDPHAAGTRELVTVLSGQLRMRLGEDTHDLSPGDTISFLADQAHTYENPAASELRCHDIIIYTR